MAVNERFKAFLIAPIVALAGFAAVGMTTRDAHANGAVRFFFYNPSRTIECRFSNGAVACASFKSAKVVVLNSAGAAQIATIKRFGSKNPVCHALPGDDVPCWFQQGGPGPTLRLGRLATDPDPRIYRCSSRASGIACRSLPSRRGFEISDERIVKLVGMKHP